MTEEIKNQNTEKPPQLRAGKGTPVQRLVRQVCANCNHFGSCMWQGDDDRLLGTCNDSSKIIHYEGTVVNHDNAPTIIDGNKQTCFNYTPNVKNSRPV